jgi:glutamyl-tRNA reductase
MNILVLGLNHKTAPVEVREKLAFSPAKVGEALARLRQQMPTLEAVVLSTCNRVELYTASEGAPPSQEALAQFLAEFHGLQPEALLPHLYALGDRDAVKHLFMVASSLDSMVLGESEIKAQVTEAYMLAAQHEATGKLLNALFQASLGIAKEVHTHTAISAGKVSVSSVAVDFAERIFQNFSDKGVLVIGAGEMSEQTLKHLVDRGVHSVIVANRTYDRAVALAEDYGGEAIRFELLADALPRADIVISSSGAPHYVIHPDQVRDAMRRRKSSPMFFIDISVPRNVDPRVNDLENVYLFNIDDLQQAVNRNLEEREKELEKCLALVEDGVARFVQSQAGAKVAPTITKLSDALHQIKDQEMARLLPKIENLSEKDKNEIDHMADRIVHKILHGPLEELKAAAQDGRGHTYIQAIKRLFRISD